jgi:hypothetical protein
MSSAGFTEEETYGVDEMLSSIKINISTSDIQEKYVTVYNTFTTLLQYPSLLSRFKKIRNLIQEKIDAFSLKPNLPLYFIDLLQRVKIMLDGISHRSDYIE